VPLLREKQEAHCECFARCECFICIQGGEDPWVALSCRSFFAKEPLTIGLVCRKWPVKIRHPVGLRHPVCASRLWLVWHYIYEHANASCKHTSQHVYALACRARLIICNNIPLQHTATHCNTYQHTATYCNILQHTATHCNMLPGPPYNLQQYTTTTHCNTLQRSATHCTALHHTAPHCTTLHHTAPQYSALQHTTTRCNTLQHLPAEHDL